ncbi:MAG TPA: OsmC family peroxiredoxin [Thermoanaerobaculia bacterium]
MRSTFARHAVLDWAGDVTHGAGSVSAGTGAFTTPASFPRLTGEQPGITTPEELLAASHAVCYGIGLRSVIASRGGSARRIEVTATITAQKEREGIRIVSSHLTGSVEGLEGLTGSDLEDVAKAAEQGCTISNAIRPSVAITHDIRAV